MQPKLSLVWTIIGKPQDSGAYRVAEKALMSLSFNQLKALKNVIVLSRTGGTNGN